MQDAYPKLSGHSPNRKAMQDLFSEAKRLVCEEAPEVIEAVELIVTESAKLDERIPLEFSLERFHDDPMLLYAALLYATSRGVTVTFLPREAIG